MLEGTKVRMEQFSLEKSYRTDGFYSASQSSCTEGLEEITQILKDYYRCESYPLWWTHLVMNRQFAVCDNTGSILSVSFP